MKPKPRYRTLHNPSQTSLSELGGLALFDGVMVRSKTGVGFAIRLKDNSVLLRQIPLQSKNIILKLIGMIPILRGILALIQMGKYSILALTFSAWIKEINIPKEKLRTVQLPLPLRKELWLYASLSILLMVVFIVLFPSLFNIFGKDNILLIFLNSITILLIQYFAILIYAFLIGRLSEIKRVYQYHGAEHRAIWNYQSVENLSISAANQFPLRHPQCGTVFMVIVLLTFHLLKISTSFFQVTEPLIYFMPLILLLLSVGLGYEFFRLMRLWPKTRLVQILQRPGFILQRITTRAPSDQQVEVALLALQTALAIEPDQKQEKGWVVQGLHID